MSRPRRPARRGWLTRGIGALFGAALAAGGIVAMQLPLLHQRDHATVSLADLPATNDLAPALVWPSQGSAAVVIPAYGVRVSSNDDVVPIASLSKMMTAYVVLRQLPLTGDESGPCVTVNAADYALYQHMVVTGQSSVKVAVGEVLCERDLMNGLLVHSANNYAILLSVMAAGSVRQFVAMMNDTAAQLGLRHTHYAEPSGYQAGSVSTALEQAELAALIMQSPLVRSIVDQTSVTLPVAGTVTTFTPYVGVDNVIGVKSGRTVAAGGCVAMAMTFQRGAATETLYAVVLGQRGGDLLGAAGAAALALAFSARDNQLHLTFAAGTPVGTVGWGAHRTPVVLTRTHSLWWWAGAGPLATSIRLRPLRSGVHRGEVVGWLTVRGDATYRFAVSAARAAAPATIWQRLR
ncbi:MAG: D-alanyl-D-alanine carboxypeptidase family protein [Acidimicrobiales bacterium]